MPRIIQINVTSNWGSTGKIAEECNLQARTKGWETYFAFGRYNNPSESKVIAGPSSKWNVFEHFLECRLLDNEGLASRGATYNLVERIKEIQPDIVHLHNIHDHWLNFQILFDYLNRTDIKIVWTFHDFWAITGHCAHFVGVDCDRYQSECYDCPYTKGKIIPLIKREKRNFNLKKRLLLDNRFLTIVPVSEWVGEHVRQSFLKDRPIHVIPNGIDTSLFKPTKGFNHQKITQDTFVIMAVSSQWKSRSKGMNDFIAMAKILKDDEVIILVGVSDEEIKKLPSNMIGIKRTNNQQELAALYTRANVVCSFSSAETFGLTIVEGYACGTPAVVYDNTAPPELITPETGYVSKNHDWKDAYKKIQLIKMEGKYKYSDACINLAHQKYDKKICFNDYMGLYDKLNKQYNI